VQGYWNKYGAKSFTFAIIEECPMMELANRESYWIKRMNADMNLAPVIETQIDEYEIYRRNIIFGKKRGKKIHPYSCGKLTREDIRAERMEEFQNRSFS
jgi:hypothetical protein